MDDDLAWQQIAAERLALADLLDTLTPEQWRTPSLCGAWTVEGVATHVMVGPTGSLAQFATAMLRARGRFARANEVMVERRLHRPTSAVVADLRDHAADRFTPPGFDWHAPLTDLLVHRLDICVPLGVDHGRPLDPWVDAMGLLVGAKAEGAFVDRGRPTLTLVATDVDWSAGDGPRVEAPVEALALALTRRPTGRLDELVGPGAPVLRAWAERT